jgi:hypothetical protein
VREAAAAGGPVGQRREAGEEGIGTQVAKEEGEKLLLPLQEALGKGVGRLLPKEVVRDECGHVCSQ